MVSLWACSSADLVDMSGVVAPESLIGITIEVPSDTKGEQVNSPEDMISIGVYCAKTGDVEWSSGADFSKMGNDRYTLSDSGEWVCATGAESWDYEELTDKYTFFSYSPHDSDVQCITPNIVGGELVIDYVVPNSSLDQPDLMYARPIKDTTPQIAGYVPLSFVHALCSVSFGVISADGAKVESLYITGVVGDGSLSWDYELDGPSWSLGNLSYDPFVVKVDNYTFDATNYAQINSEQGYLMMIPQTFPDGAEVVMKFEGDEAERTLTIPKGSEWVAGSSYTYVVDLDHESDFIFDSDELSNCYIINPASTAECVIQIPIEDRINDFWKNYSGNNSKKINGSVTKDDLYIDMVWHDFEDTFEFSAEVIEDSEKKLAAQIVVTSEFQEGNFVFVVSEILTKDNTPYKSALWSWHLWFTYYNPDIIAAANVSSIEPGVDKAYKLTGYEGAVHRYQDASSGGVWSGIYSDKFIMDRNIGERKEFASDGGSGTVYFQYGRKDPFPGYGATYLGGGSQPAVKTTSSYTFEDSVLYHYNYVAPSNSSTGNWSIEGDARSATYIWFDNEITVASYNGEKSIFDPSPLGWMVPVRETWSSFSSASGCGDISSVGKYNYYGYRDPYKSAAPSCIGEFGCVWSANPFNTESGYYLYYSDSEVSSLKTLMISYGLPVRAIQE